MDHHIRLHATTVVIVIALGLTVSLITSTVVAARAYTGRAENTAREYRTIDVKGSTRQRIRSDQAVWSISVIGRGAALTDAFAILDDGVNRVRQFLKDMDFSDTEIGLSAIDTTEHYARDAKGNFTREITEYTLQRSFTVTTTDVIRVNRTAGRGGMN